MERDLQTLILIASCSIILICLASHHRRTVEGFSPRWIRYNYNRANKHIRRTAKPYRDKLEEVWERYRKKYL